MATVKDRMKRAGPMWRVMADRIDSMIVAINELRDQAIGKKAHKVDDTTDVIALSSTSSLDAVIDIGQEMIDKYETHIGSTTYHPAADSTNVVTEIGVAKEVYALLNELKLDYEAHRILVAASVHAGTDAVNVIAAANATSKALAVALANELVADLQLNFADVTSHHGGSGDTVGIAALVALNGGVALSGSSTWTQIALVADGIRSAYEAHRVLTAGSVHGAADNTNTVTATAVGTIQTAVNNGLSELKTDLNAHIILVASHISVDQSMLVTAAAATDYPTSQALAAALRSSINDHISSATDISSAIPLLSETA